MKKLIAAGFAFLFLLTVVAGCPKTSGGPKANDSGTVNFDDTNSSTTTSDASADDIAI